MCDSDKRCKHFEESLEICNINAGPFTVFNLSQPMWASCFPSGHIWIFLFILCNVKTIDFHTEKVNSNGVNHSSEIPALKTICLLSVLWQRCQLKSQSQWTVLRNSMHQKLIWTYFDWLWKQFGLQLLEDYIFPPLRKTKTKQKCWGLDFCRSPPLTSLFNKKK